MSDRTIRILVVDDHEVVRKGIGALLATEALLHACSYVTGPLALVAALGDRIAARRFPVDRPAIADLPALIAGLAMLLRSRKKI